MPCHTWKPIVYSQNSKETPLSEHTEIEKSGLINLACEINNLRAFDLCTLRKGFLATSKFSSASNARLASILAVNTPDSHN